MTLLVAVFLSGASALLLETLWFRVTGLTLGNGVWASSVVLCAFMAGLALGNGLAGWQASRLRRPLVAYAGLECVVGVLGLALVLLLPRWSGILGPLLRPLLDRPVPLNLLRLLTAFALLVVPAAAMGATLPIVTRALPPGDFARGLGRLYGANTLGAVAGALAGEVWLIERFGIRGTALAAAALNAGAAALAVAASSPAAAAAGTPAPAAVRADGRARALLAATFGCGAILLALEVIWFRFLALRLIPSSLSFAVMLAVVLAGLSAGSFALGRWSAARPGLSRHAPEFALAAGILVVLTYAASGDPGPDLRSGVRDVVGPAAALMLPVCLLSGALFVLLGAGLQARLGDRSRATGALTMANTLGAMAGAVLAGFVLLPRLGLEVSILTLAVAYGVVALLAAAGIPGPGSRRDRIVRGAAAALFLLAMGLFPFGTASAKLRARASFFTGDGSSIEAVREGVLETLVYLRKDLWGQPFYHRMLTNGYTMAGTNPGAARYMRLFAYWPLALRPDARSALLICYGVGNTARTLARTPGLASIDVVEISPDVLRMSPLVFPAGERPLDDPRVRVHVEDGRFFLLASDRRFDVITAEPPPPKCAGVVNLYSREYFQLVHDRLTDGGVTTHWLPVYQLSPADAKAIIAAFCSVFEDCTLWTGAGLEWMLGGTRGLARPPSAEAFSQQWKEPRAAADLEEEALEVPEQLGTLFIADAPFLREAVRGHPPLDDDHPLRLSPRQQLAPDPWFVELMDAGASRERFARSEFIRRCWPPEMRERAAEQFESRATIDRLFLHQEPSLRRLDDLRRALTGSTLRSLPLLLMDTNPGEVRLARAAAERGVRDPVLGYLQGLHALADRDYAAADASFQEAERAGAPVDNLHEARALALALGGDPAGARALASKGRPEFRAWMEGVFPQ